MSDAATISPPRYSCGHLRTEKGKHACPECLAARRAIAAEKYRARARAKYNAKPGRAKEAAPAGRPQAVVSAERRAAAIARIKAAIEGTHDWKVIAARLGGVSRQRVFQLLKLLDTDSPEARLFREAERLKREFYRAEKKKRHYGMPMCRAANPGVRTRLPAGRRPRRGALQRLPPGHGDLVRMNTKNDPSAATHHATAEGSGVQTTPSYPFRVGNTTEEIDIG